MTVSTLEGTETGVDAGLEAFRRLYAVMGRVTSSADLSEVLQTVADGVVDVLGFGIAAISQLDGDVLVMSTIAGGTERDRAQILGRRTPMTRVADEYRNADRWGILRFVPHARALDDDYEIWVPDMQVSDDPDAWHPMDTLYAPLYSPTGELLGNMAVDLPPNNRIPDQGQREVLEMYAVQAGTAMFNAQQRERLAEQVRLGEATRAIVAAGAKVLDIQRVLEDSLGPLLTGLRARAVWTVSFQHDESGRREQMASSPPEMAATTTPEMLDRAHASAQRSWSLGRAATYGLDGAAPEDERAAYAVATMAERGDLGRMLVVPMGAGPEALGLISLMRAEADPPWGSEEVEAALEIGRELGRSVLHARLFETERRLVAELKELDTYKGELMATIAHELKNPLTSIGGYVEFLQEGGDLEVGLGAIGRNTERLRGLVGDLLELARLEEVGRTLDAVPVDLREICEQTVAGLQMQASQADVRLCLDAPLGKTIVPGDAEELSRMVDNLVGNAVKYGREGGRATVTLTPGDDTVELAVTDTGLGIADSDLPDLFSAFTRSSNPEARSRPGTGLGLAITQRIVEMHHGTIRVDSRLGEGSTFRVTLPLGGVAA